MEKATKHNFGIEIGLWNKLDLTLDLFKENRKDILMTPQTTSSIVGATFNAINRGETKNHGLELELRWNDKIGRNFNYWGALTFAASENRIVYKDDPRNADEHLKAAGKPIDYQNRFIAVGNYGSIDDVFNYAQTAINGTTAITSNSGRPYLYRLQWRRDNQLKRQGSCRRIELPIDYHRIFFRVQLERT